MITSEQKNALLTTRLCQYLNASELNILLEHSSAVSFAAGKMILKQGKMTDGLYIILKGTAIVTAKILGEGTITLAKLGHGNFIGEISVIDNGPCAASVITTSAVECLFIKTPLFNALLLFFPIKYQMLKAITHEVCERLIETQKKIIAYMTASEIIEKSIFGIIKESLTKHTIISFEDAKIDHEKLKKLDFFNLLTQKEYDELIQNATLISAPNNCVLIKEQDSEMACYIVLRGAIQSSIVYDHKVAKLFVLGPYKLFCNLSTFDNTLPSIIQYTTCEQAILLKISADKLAAIQNNNTALWSKIFELICKSFVMLERYTDKLDIRLHSEIYNR